MTNPLVPKLLSEAVLRTAESGQPIIAWERSLTQEEKQALSDWLDSVTPT